MKLKMTVFALKLVQLNCINALINGEAQVQ